MALSPVEYHLVCTNIGLASSMPQGVKGGSLIVLIYTLVGGADRHISGIRRISLGKVEMILAGVKAEMVLTGGKIEMVLTGGKVEMVLAGEKPEILRGWQSGIDWW